MIWMKLEAKCLGGHSLVTVKKESRGGRVLPTITDGARQQKVDLGNRAGPYGREWSLMALKSKSKDVDVWRVSRRRCKACQ